LFDPRRSGALACGDRFATDRRRRRM